MRRLILASLVTAIAAALPHPAAAQRGRGQAPPDRVALEQRFRDRLASVVQKQVGLSDDEMRRLAEVNQKYEPLRLNLVRRERQARMALRKELMESGAPSEDRVAQQLQELARIQHERLDVTDNEQADLARFLTPSQRAKYLGLQEQTRRRIEQFRDRPGFVDDSLGGRPGAPGRGRKRPPA